MPIINLFIYFCIVSFWIFHALGMTVITGKKNTLLQFYCIFFILCAQPRKWWQEAARLPFNNGRFYKGPSVMGWGNWGRNRLCNWGIYILWFTWTMHLGHISLILLIMYDIIIGMTESGLLGACLNWWKYFFWWVKQKCNINKKCQNSTLNYTGSIQQMLKSANERRGSNKKSMSPSKPIQSTKSTT